MCVCVCVTVCVCVCVCVYEIAYSDVLLCTLYVANVLSGGVRYSTQWTLLFD